MAGLGFAKKQLEKHGWEEGKGLGKEEGGITKAIKVGVKNDTRGVGFDLGEQFTFHWWDHIFNKTAKSIVVKESEDGVEVSKDSDSNQPISNKRPSKNSQKALFYGRFVKASTSTSETKEDDSDSDSEAEKDYSNQHPEDKVFQACGGRTAHKGARHGLKLNGKLRRIEEHEKMALSAPCSRSASPDLTQEQGIDENELKTKLKRKKEKRRERISYSDSEEYIKKKKKRKRKELIEAVSNEAVTVEIEIEKLSKKKKKQKKDQNESVIENETNCEEVSEKRRKKKDIKRSSDANNIDTNEIEDIEEEKLVKKSKKKKTKSVEEELDTAGTKTEKRRKNKRSKSNDDETEFHSEDEDNGAETAGKKSEKKRSKCKVVDLTIDESPAEHVDEVVDLTNEEPTVNSDKVVDLTIDEAPKKKKSAKRKKDKKRKDK